MSTREKQVIWLINMAIVGGVIGAVLGRGQEAE